MAPSDEKRYTYRKDIAKDLNETAEVEETGDGLQDGIGIETNKGLDSLDGPLENVDDLFKKRLDNLNGNLNMFEVG